LEIIMKTLRRRICLVVGSWLGLGGLTGCIPTGPGKPVPPVKAYSAEEQRRMHKFRGIDGYERRIDAAETSPGLAAQIFDDYGNSVETGTFQAGGSSISSLGIRPSGLMKSLSVTLFEPGSTYAIQNAPWGKHFSGTIIGQWTVPVADRIPDDLLDELRQRGGLLRIKIRLHREGVLLGWDIERTPNPMRVTRAQKLEAEKLKRSIILPHAYTHTGGDFKEARLADYVWDGSGFKGLPNDIPAHRPEIHYMRPWRFENLIRLPTAEQLGGVVPKEWAEQGLYIASGKDHLGNYRGVLKEKGWYIHPKTGQRIETDF
jgi:hypothetical protein